MRDLTLPPIARFRRRDARTLAAFGDFGNARCGAFFLPPKASFGGYTSAASIAIVASSDAGWDHVSASCKVRCPTWAEMMLVHRLFFEDHETSMQLMVPPTEHINHHPNCLHLWAPTDPGVSIPLPPGWMVGPADAP